MFLSCPRLQSPMCPAHPERGTGRRPRRHGRATSQRQGYQSSSRRSRTSTMSCTRTPAPRASSWSVYRRLPRSWINGSRALGPGGYASGRWPGLDCRWRGRVVLGGAVPAIRLRDHRRRIGREPQGGVPRRLHGYSGHPGGGPESTTHDNPDLEVGGPTPNATPISCHGASPTSPPVIPSW